jgi:hypothetical protein
MEKKRKEKKKEEIKKDGKQEVSHSFVKAEREEVSEIFEVEKEGKTEVIETHGVEESKQGAEDGEQEVSHSPVNAEQEEKAPSESQIKKEKKIFMEVIFVMLGLVLVFFAVFMIINYTKTFEYNGAMFYIDKEDLVGITLYKTSLPITINNGTEGTYNFYLRKDPRTLKDVTFDGDLIIRKNMVINMTNNFNCDGNGIIAIANLMKLYNVMGANVMKDENATCDPEGRYMFLRIEEGNATKIEQFGPSCYNMYINNCEILEGTERFMIETFSEINKVMKE